MSQEGRTPATIGGRSSADVGTVTVDEPLDRLSHLWRAYSVTASRSFKGSRTWRKSTVWTSSKSLDVLLLVGTSCNSPRTRKPILLVRLTGALVGLAMMFNGHQPRFERGDILAVGFSQVSLND